MKRPTEGTTLATKLLCNVRRKLECALLRAADAAREGYHTGGGDGGRAADGVGQPPLSGDPLLELIRRKPTWFDAVVQGGELLPGPPEVRGAHGAVVFGEHMLIYGGEYAEPHDYDGEVISHDLIAVRNIPGRADPRSGREMQEWRELAVDNCVQRSGHGMCASGGDVYLFGGVTERGTFANDLYLLQYVRRAFGSTGAGGPVAHPTRARSMLLPELLPCVEPEREVDEADYVSDDDSSVFSYRTKRADLHAGVGGTAHLMFTFPHGDVETGAPAREHMVIESLPNLVNPVGAENAYTLSGENLAEIFERQNRSRVEAGHKPRDFSHIEF